VNLDEYDRRWESMAAEGKSIHGEIDFIERLLPDRRLNILDAGCGTGRLAVEAVRRGHRATGVDLDPDMIERARVKNAQIEWICADLASVRVGRLFDVAVMAGNVPLYCLPGAQTAIIANLVAHLAPDGVLICGFGIEKGKDAYSPDDMRRDSCTAGCDLVDQYANWDGDPSDPTGTNTYAVMVCRRSGDI
jgi:SAM-dependent methyltransferase